MEDQLSIGLALLLAVFAVAPVFQLSVAALIGRAYYHGKADNTALLASLITAISLSASSILLSILALNRLFLWHIDNDLAIGMLFFALLLMGVPAISWLYLYIADKF
jgi:predicted Na+-dependent transporter